VKIIKEILSWTAHILLASCWTFNHRFCFAANHVQGISMESTLHNNDRVLVNKLIHTLRLEPDYGDIVIIDKRIDRPRTIADDIMDSLRYNAISYHFNKDMEEIFGLRGSSAKPATGLNSKTEKFTGTVCRWMNLM